MGDESGPLDAEDIRVRSKSARQQARSNGPYEDIPGGKVLNKGKGKGGAWTFAENVKNVGRVLRGMKGGTKCVYSPEELRDRLDDRREEMERMAEMEGKRANADMDLD
ncbi:unnamed protein product [Closterium sp. NIES-53]